MSKLFKELIYFFIFLVLFSGVFFSEVYTGDITESVGVGVINYSTGRVRASGIGTPSGNIQSAAEKKETARMAADITARRNLLEVLKGVRFDSETILEKFITQNGVINAQISSIVENSQEVTLKEHPDGSFEVTVEIPLQGQLLESILTNTGSGIPAFKPDETQNYTGLIVDCIGLGIKPAIAPKIFDEGGKELYGLSHVAWEFAVRQGIAGYVKSLADAVKNDRAGKNPIVIKGLASEGSMQVNVVINSSYREKLEKINETQTFLRQCKVIFVI
ncbi:MAG: hypothetical protein AB1498_03070 [bacterium]